METDSESALRAGEVVLPVIAANPATCRIGALTANATVPASAIGGRAVLADGSRITRCHPRRMCDRAPGAPGQRA